MALRAIDNAMANPILPEKRKKPHPSPIKQSDLGVTDENCEIFPTSRDPAVDYIASQDLKPVLHPEALILEVIDGLDSKDWLKVCESLNNARRFALFHSSLLKPNLDKLLAVLEKAMKNPRSALCKTSIMASSDFFLSFGDELLESTGQAFDNMIMQLLLKASQDKRFVCEEADKALEAMVKFMTPVTLLSKLQAYVNHSNPRVRAKAAVATSHAVSRMSLEDLEKAGIVSMVKMAVELMNDRLPNAREAARKVLESVHEAYTATREEKNDAWEEFCMSNLSSFHAQTVVKLTIPMNSKCAC